MRFGITILTDLPWADAAPKWRRAEELGFDHAWIYDHLSWGGLPESPWRAAIPTLTAAAMITSTIRLGTFVSSPNFRQPLPFAQEVLTLDDLSAGRLSIGIGVGGDLDNRMMGGSELSNRERVDRFEEFVALYDRALTTDSVSQAGRWFTAVDADLPLSGTQRPRVPVLLAANGPRTLRFAAENADGWVTYGKPSESTSAADEAAWWESLRVLSARLDDALASAGRSTEPFERHLNLDSGPRLSLRSVDGFVDDVGRARELGFTDLISHWPRPTSPFAAPPAVLEDVAALLPTLR